MFGSTFATYARPIKNNRSHFLEELNHMRADM